MLSGMDMPAKVMAARTGICAKGNSGARARQASKNNSAKAHQPTTESTDTNPMPRLVSLRSHCQAIVAAAAATANDSSPTPGLKPIKGIPAARKTTDVPARRSAETAPTLRFSTSLRSRPAHGRSSTARNTSPANPPGSTALTKAACQQRPTAEPRPTSIPWPRATILHLWACTATPTKPKISAPRTAGRVRTEAAAAKGPAPHRPTIQSRIPAATATCTMPRPRGRRLTGATALPRRLTSPRDTPSWPR